MRSGFLPARIVHVHPTQRCNLACVHCYSSSSPRLRDEISGELLVAALSRLRREGYEIVSFSGGEPFIYRDLTAVVGAAHELGYRVHVVTNGTMLTDRRLRLLGEHLDLVAVSLDGTESTHNRVRGTPRAFQQANMALERLAGTAIPFGIAFTVSTHSLPDVPWAYERALQLGARLLHLRPLASAGRAQALEQPWFLSQEDCARLVVLAELLASSAEVDRPRVQVDLVATSRLSESADAYFESPDGHAPVSLSDHVNPLVINEHGLLLPFTYTINPELELGQLEGWCDGTPLDEQALAATADVVRLAFARVAERGSEYVDWYEQLTAMSYQLLHVVSARVLTTPGRFARERRTGQR
jgi:Fe-coproporphyrin III synthase